MYLYIYDMYIYEMYASFKESFYQQLLPFKVTPGSGYAMVKMLSNDTYFFAQTHHNLD